MMTYILMSWFKEDTKKWKTSFLKETVENADLYKAVLKKTITAQEKCVKYDFVAPLTKRRTWICYIGILGNKYCCKEACQTYGKNSSCYYLQMEIKKFCPCTNNFKLQILKPIFH